jgi:Predicted signal-transduction protein containing cAMP-binding and CBS domains
MKTVSDIIASKPRPENIIEPKELVIEALRLMDHVNMSYVIVMDGDEYKGIFSERDYSRNVALKGKSSSTATVQEVMNTELPRVIISDSVEHCMSLMARYSVRYLVAFDEDKFAGIITIHDLLRLILANRSDVFEPSLTQQLVDTAESGGKIY